MTNDTKTGRKQKNKKKKRRRGGGRKRREEKKEKNYCQRKSITWELSVTNKQKQAATIQNYSSSKEQIKATVSAVYTALMSPHYR